MMPQIENNMRAPNGVAEVLSDERRGKVQWGDTGAIISQLTGCHFAEGLRFALKLAQ